MKGDLLRFGCPIDAQMLKQVMSGPFQFPIFAWLTSNYFLSNQLLIYCPSCLHCSVWNSCQQHSAACNITACPVASCKWFWQKKRQWGKLDKILTCPARQVNCFGQSLISPLFNGVAGQGEVQAGQVNFRGSLPRSEINVLQPIHSGTEGGRTCVAYFAVEGVFFKTSHVRDFVKEGYFFVRRYEVWGSKSPYNPRNIRGSDAEWLPKWLGFRVCCRHYVFLFIQCQCFDKRRGVYLVEKISVLLK